MIATNTIAQGDTRLTGLATIETEGGIIFKALTDLIWPGQAAVVVNVIHIGKKNFRPPYQLNERDVDYISNQLSAQKVLGDPYILQINGDKSFVGSFVNGMGFVLSPQEAETLLSKDIRNKDVILPYLNGEDLNTNPDQSPSRWVINFFDWPLDRNRRGSWFHASEHQQKEWKREGSVPNDYPAPVASDYPEVLAIIRERVYPIRAEVRREAHKKYWWHYGDKRPALYSTIASTSVDNRSDESYACFYICS